MADKEMVNHPSHYCRPGRKECIDEMIDLYGIEATEQWCRMTAYKYHYRMGLKDDIAQEVGKAEWYERKADELRKLMIDKKEKQYRRYNTITTVVLTALAIILTAGFIFGSSYARESIVVGTLLAIGECALFYAQGVLVRFWRNRKHDSK